MLISPYKGDILYINAAGQDIVIVNSAKIAEELFEKRSNVYSDRPIIPMVDMYVQPSGNFDVADSVRDRMGWEFNVGVIPYGDLWRKHRRMFQQGFKKQTAHTYQPIQAEKIHDMLWGLLHSPEEFLMHIRTYVFLSGYFHPNWGPIYF